MAMGECDCKIVGRRQPPLVKPRKLMDADPDWASQAEGVIKAVKVTANAVT
ncbi:MAG TPA: hypothetical protein VN112_06155 [Ensifer sp.]|nr:hypothetical protein [Ensifer sp.]